MRVRYRTVLYRFKVICRSTEGTNCSCYTQKYTSKRMPLLTAESLPKPTASPRRRGTNNSYLHPIKMPLRKWVEKKGACPPHQRRPQRRITTLKQKNHGRGNAGILVSLTTIRGFSEGDGGMLSRYYTEEATTTTT